MANINLKKGVASLVLLALSYILGSRALDTGSYWEYLGCVVALVFAVKFMIHAVKKHGKEV